MTTIEYEGVRIFVPDSWDDVPLGVYETFCGDDPATARDRVALVAKICGVDTDLLLSWPAEIFNRIVGLIGFLFKDNPASPNSAVEIDGVRYVVPMEDELSLGAWVDADAVQKRGERILSGVLAIVCRPSGEKYDDRNNEMREAMFAALPVSKVLPVLAFFLQCKTVSDLRTEAFTRMEEILDLLPRNFATFVRRGDGTRLSRIWQAVRLWILTGLLSYRLRRFIRSSCTSKTGSAPTKRSVGWIRFFRKA